MPTHISPLIPIIRRDPLWISSVSIGHQRGTLNFCKFGRWGLAKVFLLLQSQADTSSHLDYHTGHVKGQTSLIAIPNRRNKPFTPPTFQSATRSHPTQRFAWGEL